MRNTKKLVEHTNKKKEKKSSILNGKKGTSLTSVGTSIDIRQGEVQMAADGFMISQS